MSSEMQLYSVASLLRRGRALDQLSTGLTLLGALYGLAQYLLASVTLGGLIVSLALVLLGLVEKYLALRVAFDADLFQRVADSPTSLEHSTQALDQALGALGLQPAEKGGRPWDQRSRGALGLLRRQALLLAAQVLTLLSLILASPWLTFAG
ncbi:hypothetical protein DNK59_13010 [Pseudomonas sp. TKO26]|uniref:Uncharacterized protein n=1 Tax=Pseudomonas saponiphila TaxID=556534 RepID=A0A1H4UZY8_9PSED|nr:MULTISPECIES: hypothetical protein [Pseudomonas]PYY86415.1 hypothetical protein DNK62_13010 [Pseudomonas sp. TKO30]PYY89166.1 hypothetical protein DNK61_13005 [Pseudomonas sp. TKO29]PYY91839.1 hypothetical protein DNK59_13010 [Pseudomonas sp. TKO26]PYY99948.1 hypothetical protein DNK60_13005 [Pseudomonas sp. TKO14]SEC73988.1 hypothetical protein SAMN05216178_4683 [Pseudomonas saponiphila]